MKNEYEVWHWYTYRPEQETYLDKPMCRWYLGLYGNFIDLTDDGVDTTYDTSPPEPAKGR